MFFRQSSPVAPAAPLAVASRAPTTPPPPAMPNVTRPHGVILVVDDSPLIRSVVTKALQVNNHEVHLAENGRLGLETWERLKDSIQLVVSDVFMPEMDGLTMAREIRKRSRTVPILIMSSKLDDDTRWVAEEAGFPLLPKPFKDEVLRLLVDRLLRTPRHA